MKLENPALLKTVFAMKRNFARGCAPTRKVFSGIEIAPYKGNADAAFCVSADFEMSWAWRACGEKTTTLLGARERDNVPKILRLLEEYSLPITWATVGHLFLENCTRSSCGVPHADMPRPPANLYWTGDWYVHDPCSDLGRDPLWYAPDLIQQVIDCRTPQEIGTHSFSHINFSRQHSTSELARRELETCIEAMQGFRLKPRSLVFPLNVTEYSYLKLYSDLGITSVRHRDEKVTLSYPERTSSGVYKLYETMNLRTAKHYHYFQKAKIFLDEAIARRATFCFWFHPSDPMEWFETQFIPIANHVQAERRKGRLWVATMEQLAAYCEARDRLSLRMTRENNNLFLEFESTFDEGRYGQTYLTLVIPVECEPASAWLQENGKRTAVSTRFIGGKGSHQLLVDIPTGAKSLQLTF
jgi:hypothetical protein